MRKRVFTPTPQDIQPRGEGWLNLDGAAVVEVTSEETAYPIESALVAGEMRGWRAAASGTQTVRLIFDEPQRLARISLVFEEIETERTQDLFCDGLQTAGARFEKLCASSGISVPQMQVARSRSISLTSPGSPFLN
jgi:hypothetical protein